MTLRTVSLYDPNTGLFTGEQFSTTNPRHVLVPAGRAAMNGVHDHLSRRVDLKKRSVVDYQPPAPDADHEWNKRIKRWVKRPDILESEAKERAAKDEIERLERSQLRALREFTINPLDETAKQRLIDIDREIAKNRKLMVQAIEDRKSPIHKVTDALSNEQTPDS